MDKAISKVNTFLRRRGGYAVVSAALFFALLSGCTPNSTPPIPTQSTSMQEASPSPSPVPATPASTPYAVLAPEGDTVRTRFRPPQGYERKQADGYGEFLRDQELLPDGSPVLLYNGEEAYTQGWHAAVLSLSVGDRDLQQCADAALRLRCEYLYSIGAYEKINYHLTNGDEFPYSKWREGYRLEVDGNNTRMVKKAQPDESYDAFYAYMQKLFNYASTRSLYPESTVIPRQDIKPGDILIFSGSPGHCIIVIDVCENELGEKAILLAQSNMPAQQVHILRPPYTDQPWMFLNELWGRIQIMSWGFTDENIRRMP